MGRQCCPNNHGLAVKKCVPDASSGFSLPTEQDFDPYGGDLDARSACRNFGGRSIADALERFRGNPLYSQEDFMFMGARAFAFYFPVLEAFLQEFRVSDAGNESMAALLGWSIAKQLQSSSAADLAPIHPAIRALADYVCSHTELLGSAPAEQQRIAENWQSVYQALDSGAS